MATATNRMPPLLIDEVLLIMDTYFRLKHVENISEKKS